MKKIIIGLLALASALTFYSCQKSALNRFQTNSVQTVAYDIKNTATAVTLSQATQVALKFLQQKNPNATISLKNAMTVVKNDKPYFHIINVNQGFAILSPDSAYVPVLAYDSINNFSFADNNLNWGLKQWFNKHAIEIDFIRNTHNSYTDSIGSQNKFLWNVLGGSIKNGGAGNFVSATNPQKGQPVVNVTPPTLISTVPCLIQLIQRLGLYVQHNGDNGFRIINFVLSLTEHKHQLVV